jgi:hypothetical protein
MKNKFEVTSYLSMVFILLLIIPNANATLITLTPDSSSVFVGDAIRINVVADIDPADAIVGFGFDSDVSGTGSLAYLGFTPNSPTFDVDPVHELLSDTDGILGASGGDLLFGSPISGAGILLGALTFRAIDVGDVLVSISADDLDNWFTEGLIPEDIFLTNFMPEVFAASINISQPTSIPEPATLFLLGAGLVGIAISRRKQVHRVL